jgi:hypothetical protein
MLQKFVTENREEIIRRCRAKVATRVDPPPTESEINHGVPLFLDQLVVTLRLGLSSSPEITSSAVQHGHELLVQGFTVSQVVHDYGDVCQSITDLAVEEDKTISADDFRTLNRCLDDAIAGAVTEFGRDRHQPSSAGKAVRRKERLGVLNQELRSLSDTALVAFDVIKSGHVGVAGSTGAVLQSSLMAIGILSRRAIAEENETN